MLVKIALKYRNKWIFLSEMNYLMYFCSGFK